MTKRRYGKHKYKFTEKTHSIRGMIAVFLAAASLAALVYMIVISFHAAGNADMYIGSAGILALMVAVVSLFLAIASVREQETFRLAPYSALGLSIISTALWVAIYVGGII